MIYDHVSVSGIGCTCMDVEVRNPRTHISKGKALYTDYEIELKTNHPNFPLLCSKTRRRYSEFVWLRGQLGLPDVMVQGAPKLPRKQLVGRFKDNFLQNRKDGLQQFLVRLLSINPFLQESALLLFLQTNLTVQEMEHYMRTRTPGAVKSLILKLHEKSLQQKAHHKPRTKQISMEYPIAKRSLKKSSFGGRNWSSMYGDGYYLFPNPNPTSDVSNDVRQRSSTVNAGALPRGKLTLPTIPGSMDDLLPLSSGELTTDEEAENDAAHPLSRSWHGSERDNIDFILDEYEVLPYEIVTQIEEKHQEELKELGYLDLTTTSEELLNSFGNEQGCFDY